jgi:hypothetical protein
MFPLLYFGRSSKLPWARNKVGSSSSSWSMWVAPLESASIRLVCFGELNDNTIKCLISLLSVE